MTESGLYRNPAQPDGKTSSPSALNFEIKTN